MFTGFFAAYAVLAKETAGGPGGRDIFDLKLVACGNRVSVAIDLCLWVGGNRVGAAQHQMVSAGAGDDGGVWNRVSHS